jgi:DNA-binding XRE family transcriptional regulator
MNENEVGVFLKNFRMKHNETQKNMCKKLNVYSTYLVKIEKENHKVPNEIVERLLSTYPFTDAEEKEFKDIVLRHNKGKNYLGKAPEVNGWISVADGIPRKEDYYLTTTMHKEVHIVWWNGENFDRSELVIAWMPLPRPYGI